jgi:hypothetical protein
MGVDIWIREESLGQASEARCQAYRHESLRPVLGGLISERGGIKRYRQILPLESIPFPLKPINCHLIERKSGTEDQYAVVITVFRNKKQTRRRIYFNHWLSRAEYE